MTDLAPGSTYEFDWTSADGDGTPTTLAGTPAYKVKKAGSLTTSTAGVTHAENVDLDAAGALTGLNRVTIDTSADGTFYAAGNDFDVVLSAGTVGGVSVVGYVVGHFSLNHEAALRPTTAGRTLDVSAGGEAGIDLANVGSPTTTLNLSGTTIKTATDVETDTADIQSRLPAALTGAGNIKADAQVVSDKTGYALTSSERDSVADALLDRTAGVETNRTLRQTLRLMLSALAGKVSGAGTGTETFRDTNDSKNRIVATTDDDGNRSAVTLDGS